MQRPKYQQKQYPPTSTNQQAPVSLLNANQPGRTNLPKW